MFSDLLVESSHHWNQCHITTSGQQMLPRATAVMGNKQTSLKTNLEELISFLCTQGEGGDKSHRKRKEPHELWKVHYHWNQLRKATSGQQMLPRVTAPMGNTMRLGGEHGYGERQDKTKQKECKTRKSRTADQDKRNQNKINTT